MTTINTPPPSTLSLPSPTTSETNMPPPTRPLYLIVATALSPSMGIGLKGQLPWPALKKDMAFFRAVTSGASGERRNAVIMGRKTWESIPRKFRPLKGRVNVVVTRDVRGFGEREVEGVLAVEGLEEGLKELDGKGMELGNVFVIGGSTIYAAAVGGDLAGWGPVRILQTVVRKGDRGEFECDTFFPVGLEEGGEVQGWRRVSGEEVEGWVDGKAVPGGNGGWEADGSGMDIRVVGWEKVD
jgi:dihydrofolate reductase